MSFSESIVSVWNKAYRCFEGRARRSEYWFFFLFSLILSVIPIVNIIAGIALLIPGLSVAVRRLHDTGRTGWWLLLGLSSSSSSSSTAIPATTNTARIPRA